MYTSLYFSECSVVQWRSEQFPHIWAGQTFLYLSPPSKFSQFPPSSSSCLSCCSQIKCSMWPTTWTSVLLGRVSWGSNLWRNPQYSYLWERQRIWSRRITPFRFKRLRVITGSWRIGGRGRRGGRQASKTDPCEEAYNAWRKRARSANCV